MHYSQRIKALREDADMNQTTLGKKLNLNQITISQYENNKRKPTPETIIELCKIFNVSADYLLCIIDKPTPYKG